MRPLKREIDASALRRNWRAIRARSRAKRILAVVKSDAYGHGLIAAGKALATVADGFAVAEIDDARRLRRHSEKPIVLLCGAFARREMADIAALQLTPAVCDGRQLRWLKLLGTEAKLTVFLKINTGMNRLGFPLGEAAAALEALKKTAAVKKIVLMTHFARANSPHGLIAPLRATAPLRRRGCEMSLANSGATLLHGDIQDDWARVGIALYGASPAPDWRRREELGLSAVMTFRTALVAVRDLKAGEATGYGNGRRARKNMRIGIAACGYGDGYPRLGGGTAWVDNSAQCKILPPLSMELMALDITDCPRAAVGSPVELWGKNLSIDEVSAATDEISYQLFTRGRGRAER